LTWLFSVATSSSVIQKLSASLFSAEIGALINLFVPVGFFQVFDAHRSFSTKAEYLKMEDASAVSSITRDLCEVNSVAYNSRVGHKRNVKQELSHPHETSIAAVPMNSFVSVKDSLSKKPVVRLMSPAAFVNSQHTAAVHLPSLKIWLKQ
jgi:hypothetical protein